MKKKITVILKAIVFIMILVFNQMSLGCSGRFAKVSNVVNNYELQYIFLNSGEKTEINVNEQFKNSGIDFKKTELKSSDENVFKIKRGKIEAVNTGVASLTVKLYEKSSDTFFYAQSATVYVINKEEFVKVNNYEDLKNMADNKSGKYILNSDIDLAGTGDWEPLGNFPAGNAFTGMFINPNKYKIKNLSISSSENIYHGPYGGCAGGLFGSIQEAYIDGIILENANIDVSDFSGNLGSSAGGIVASVSLSMIRNCSVSGNLKAQSVCGGIAGYFSGSIIGCSFSGSVITEGSKDSFKGIAGGIAGHYGGSKKSGKISDCNVNGTINGELYAGGIVGWKYLEAEIFNCTFLGETNGNEIFGHNSKYKFN